MNAESRGRLVEVLSVLVILACVVAIGIPKWADLRRRDAAQRMLADVEVVRQAVYRFYSDSAAFPREGPGGQFSEELEFYLPATFNRTRPYGLIEYRNWPLRPPADSTGQVDTTGTDNPPASNVIAIAIVPNDARIAAAASSMAYAMPQFTMGNRFFFVLFGS
jgi:type II secretory pathway pseudopilin PulG